MKDLNLFSFTYPIENAAWKLQLETLFKRHYYFYEIGSETIDRFLYDLETKFLSIMPYYNQLYTSTLMAIDPLITSRVTERYNATSNIVSTGSINDTSSGTSEDEKKDYEYPQQDNAVTDIQAGRTLNNGSNHSTGATTTGHNTDNLIDYEKIITGLAGDQSALLKSYRSNILNINKMILNECKSLFILIY